MVSSGGCAELTLLLQRPGRGQLAWPCPTGTGTVAFCTVLAGHVADRGAAPCDWKGDPVGLTGTLVCGLLLFCLSVLQTFVFQAAETNVGVPF